MARNKEGLVIILDVRETADDKFKLQAMKCAGEVLKDKICSGKKDLVNFMVVGAKRTRNILNDKAPDDGFENIVQYPQAKEAGWQLLTEYFKFVNEEVGPWGEWLDAVKIAVESLRDPEMTPGKIQRARILLFYDFNDMQCSYQEFKDIADDLLKDEIELIVASPRIMYIDNIENGEPQAIFESDGIKGEFQVENEKYALRLVSHCNAKLYNCKEVLNDVFTTKNRKPWVWNAKLNIGSINILVSGLIAVKDESNIKLKKCWGDADETISREPRFMLHGREIQPDEADLICGYMLGSTPIPVETVEEEFPTKSEASLKFITFTKRTSIPTEYFAGDSLYWIVHQRGMRASARKLDALVKALHGMDFVMLCWRIYSAKFNSPKLVILLPNEFRDDTPASLSMIELSYHAQHHYWDFPTLATKKTDCTAEQFEAIDELIDSMDLMLSDKVETTRETTQKDLLPFDTLPHIYEQNVMDFLERKIICNASETDEQFEEMLTDKNFVDVFWKVPEPNEERAKKAAKRIKNLFPLEILTTDLWRAKATLTQPLATVKVPQGSEEAKIGIDVEAVSLQSPADDFHQLLKHRVRTQTHTTTRFKLFDLYALQMRSVLWKLIFEAEPESIDMEQVKQSLVVYRRSCLEFNRLDDYNNWLHEVKATVLQKQLTEFWQSVIVKEKLGILQLETAAVTLEEQIAVETFYALT